MYSKKIQENVQKNILTNLQAKNSLDFSGLFLGPEKKQRKLEKSSRGEKILQKKFWLFSRKKKQTEKFTEKKGTEKKFCKFLCIFWPLFGIFLVIISLFSTSYLTTFYLGKKCSSML